MTDAIKPGEVAERLERLADAIASDVYNADPWKAEEAASDAPFLRSAASLIRSLNERVERLEAAAKQARMTAGIHRQAFLDAHYGSSFVGVEIPGDDEWWSFHQAMTAALERK